MISLVIVIDIVLLFMGYKALVWLLGIDIDTEIRSIFLLLYVLALPSGRPEIAACGSLPLSGWLCTGGASGTAGGILGAAIRGLSGLSDYSPHPGYVVLLKTNQDHRRWYSVVLPPCILRIMNYVLQDFYFLISNNTERCIRVVHSTFFAYLIKLILPCAHATSMWRSRPSHGS